MKPSLLKAERKRREWSQTEVAEAVGVSIKTVSRWEQGQAVPHPYYLDKLLALFGKTAEELGLFANIDEDEDEPIQEETLLISQPTLPDIQEQISLLANPTIEPNEKVSQFEDADEDEDDLFSQQSFWTHMSMMVTFQPFNRFSSRSTLIAPKTLLTLAMIITVLLAFILQPLLHSTYLRAPSLRPPSPTSTSTEAIYSPPAYGLTIQNTDPSLQDAAQRFHQAFNAVYPQLVNRFALNPASSPTNVTLTFSSPILSPAVTSGTTININADWIRQHPTDIGLLTHELTLVVEQYPSNVPGWFATGMADYARSVYGPADDDNWSLPDEVQPQDNYLQGGPVAARFLLWLEQHTTLNIVDQLNHALQKGQTVSAIFDSLTHHTVNELWSQYQHHPNITQTPEQLYKTITSRKPLYKLSSFNLQVSQPRSWQLHIIPGLFVSNFAIQADITIVHGDGAGFIFRWDTTNGPQYRIRIRPIADSTFGTFDLVDPDSTLAFGSNSAIRQGYNQINQLTIIAQKHTIYLYINSQFITKVENSLSSDGIVAAMANDDYNPTDVWFKNIQVF
ncbi:MAG TPA: helix-turn-helix domain-containing protein [Ktedonobacteraceae bacterium]|jgi:transcriptional regulator with XRE-family HTH domain